MSGMLSFSSSRQTKNLIPSGESLPCECEDRPSGGIGLIIFSVIWMIIPGFMLVMAFMGGAPWPVYLILSGFLFVGFGIFLAGLSAMVSWRKLEFSESTVSCRSHGLTGDEQWSEPLSNYAGIFAESEYHSGGKNQSSYTLHKLILKHDRDEDRSVELYRSRSEDNFRMEQERYAKMFDLPALEETAEGVAERSVEDLDKSVRERVAEGSVEVDFDPGEAPPGENLKVDIAGDCVEIRIVGGNFPFGCMVLTAAVFATGVALCGGLVMNVTSLTFGIGLILVGFVSIGLLVAGKLITEMLTVAPEKVQKRYETRWGSFGETQIGAGAVEDVEIKKEATNKTPTSVQVLSDTEKIAFGKSLDDEEKQWVRDCVIAIISAGA